MWHTADAVDWQPVAAPEGTGLGSAYGVEVVGGGSGLLVHMPDDPTDAFVPAIYITDDLEHWRQMGRLPVPAEPDTLSFAALGGAWIAFVGSFDGPVTALATRTEADWQPIEGPAPDAQSLYPVDLGSTDVLVMDATSGTPVASLGPGPPSELAVTVSGKRTPPPTRDPNRVPLEVPAGVRCPDRPQTAEQLARIPTWLAAACFGRDRLRITGWLRAQLFDPCDTCETDANSVFRNGIDLALGPRRGREETRVWYDPRRVQLPQQTKLHRVGAVHVPVVVEGAFDSKQASECLVDSSFPAADLLTCQERFVITKITVRR
jgi:hypothetical protein